MMRRVHAQAIVFCFVISNYILFAQYSNHHISTIPADVHANRAESVGYDSVSIFKVCLNSDSIKGKKSILSSPGKQTPGIMTQSHIPEKNFHLNTQILTQEELKNLPFRRFHDYLSLNTGAVLLHDNLYVRGSKAGQVGYFLNGVAATNPFSNTMLAPIIPEAIEEIEFRTGGISAEYGGLQSGMANTRMRTGGPELKYAVDYRTDDFVKGGDEFLCTTSQGYHNLVATAGGPIFSRHRFFGAVQYNYQRNRTASFITPFEFNVLDDGYTGREVGSALPGPIHFEENYLPKNDLQSIIANGSLLFDMSDSFKLRLTGSYSEERFSGGYENFYYALRNLFWDREQTNLRKKALFNLQFEWHLNASTRIDAGLNYGYHTFKSYDPDFGDDWQRYTDILEFEKMGYDTSDWYSYRHGPERISTINNFEMTPPGAPINDYHKKSQVNLGGHFNLLHRIGRHIKIKAGGRIDGWEMRLYEVNSIYGYTDYINEHDGVFADENARNAALSHAGMINHYGWNVTGDERINSGPHSARKPLFLSGYLQTMLDYEKIQLQLGLRWEHIDAKILQPRDIDSPVVEMDMMYLDESEITETKLFYFLLPRLRVVIPIKTRMTLYGHFGQYAQMVPLDEIYRGGLRTLSRDMIDYHDLYDFYPRNDTHSRYLSYTAEPERTTQYEIGFHYRMSPLLAIKTSVYYKDFHNQLVYNSVYVDEISDYPTHVSYYRGWLNTANGSSKGVELSLTLNRWIGLSARFNYVLADVRGMGTHDIVYNQRHQGKLLVDYLFGNGSDPLNGWGMNALFSFNSGHTYDEYEDITNIPSNGRYGWSMGTTVFIKQRRPNKPTGVATTPYFLNVDLTVFRQIQLKEWYFKIYMTALNLFNRKNVLHVYPTTGRADDDGWLSSPFSAPFWQIPNYFDFYNTLNQDNCWGYLEAKGMDMWSPPRQIRFGITIERL